MPPLHALAALVLVGVGAVSKSKLSLHVNGVDAKMAAWLASTGPAVVKLLDPSPGDVKAARAASPGALLVGRIYRSMQPTDGDPATAAAAWFNDAWPTISACEDIDILWEGYNEPDVGDVEKMAWYAAFEAARVALLAAAPTPARAAVGCFSTGTPDVTQPAIVNAFAPAIDAARAHRGVLALHEYASPVMSGCFDNSTGEGWFTGRYRELYRDFLIPQNRTLPLVVTEAGIDNALCGSPDLGGWLGYCSWWASHGLPGDCAAQYTAQLAWYDGVLREDAYVVGATLFCYHCSGFAEYEVETVMPDLQAYMNAL